MMLGSKGYKLSGHVKNKPSSNTWSSSGLDARTKMLFKPSSDKVIRQQRIHFDCYSNNTQLYFSMKSNKSRLRLQTYQTAHLGKIRQKAQKKALESFVWPVFDIQVFQTFVYCQTIVSKENLSIVLEFFFAKSCREEAQLVCLIS